MAGLGLEALIGRCSICFLRSGLSRTNCAGSGSESQLSSVQRRERTQGHEACTMPYHGRIWWNATLIHTQRPGILWRPDKEFLAKKHQMEAAAILRMARWRDCRRHIFRIRAPYLVLITLWFAVSSDPAVACPN